MAAPAEAVADCDDAKVQRLLKDGGCVKELDQWGRSAMKVAVGNHNLHDMVKTLLDECLIETGGADIEAVLFATCACYPMILWLLEKCATIPANIWHNVAKASHYGGEDAAELSSLLKVLTQLPMSPYQDLGLPPFFATLSPQHTDIVTRGRQLQARLSLYVKKEQTFVRMHCALPAVLQAIVTAYALPTPTPNRSCGAVGGLQCLYSASVSDGISISFGTPSGQ
jgi:hypothetical protein